ncbi:PREDICTED: defensin-like protein 1 [Nelumbo nucifera]|uniref:Defensin-like protein 1 n=1 Tax=Nelumbo nucifera TaxID=4432 RepID=A0A1U8Q1I7_NELNU|nr:PREDICTED: defensin-like protein 1 [Nelumbo nucifera]
MAKAPKSVSYFAFFFILFLLASSEIQKTKKLCERRSKTWSGRCTKTQNCDKQCKDWEYAKHGACHGSWFNKKCYCYFDC